MRYRTDGKNNDKEETTMNVMKAGYEILTPISEGGKEELQMIERIGRVCYKSEDKITEDGESAKKIRADADPCAP